MNQPAKEGGEEDVACKGIELGGVAVGGAIGEGEREASQDIHPEP